MSAKEPASSQGHSGFLVAFICCIESSFFFFFFFLYYELLRAKSCPS